MSFEALIATLAAAAAAASSGSPTPPPGNLQDRFDAATAAWTDGNCAEAVPLFELLESDPRVRPGSLSAAAIAVRKGQCLIDLDRAADGQKSILAGLPALEAAGDDFSGEVYQAHMMLGGSAAARYDLATARTHYDAALAPAKGLARLPVLAALSKTTAFDGTSAPLDYANEALAIADAQPEPDKALRATLLTVRARVLLNQGQVDAAYDDLKEALKLSGGLTLNNVSLSEVTMRADLAQAALLAGKRDDAHRYLAYTGAGRIAESPFKSAQNMAVPVCGTESGLRPDDVAVVQFAITDDGTVYSAQTIYTRGGPEVAAAFADAVRQWYWAPEALVGIPAFYLAASRVELRCTQAGASAPAVIAPLAARFQSWAVGQLPLSPDIAGATGTIAAMQQVLAEPDIRSRPARYIAAAAMLSELTPQRPAENAILLGQALTAADGAGIPPEVLNAVRVYRALYDIPWDPDKRMNPKRDMPIFAQSLFALAGAPELAEDAIAAGTLRLSGAKYATWFKDQAPVVEQLRLVAEETRLDEHHPLRQVAFLQLANIAAAAGDLDTAQAYFTRTGLTEEQCSLLDAKPALRSARVSSRDYPTQALRLGFEGWVNVEFDIKPDGKTIGQRALIAYPPFVFSDGAASMSEDFAYETSYRPGGSNACSAKRETISFVIPG